MDFLFWLGLIFFSVLIYVLTEVCDKQRGKK